jgi:hypothetical protein
LPIEYNIETPKCYPTYKCSQDIYEYQSNGRKLDYVCFALTQDELVAYGITEAKTSVYPSPNDSVPVNKQYFRWVDDAQDVIIELEQIKSTITADNNEGNSVKVLQLEGVKNPIVGLWNKVPAFIISDLIRFSDPGAFDSPLNKVVGLADNFLFERSVYNLTKKYHGFPKAVEPVLQCTVCGGEGYKGGKACPNCTLPGQDKGTGYQLLTTIGQVMKVPIDIMSQDKAPRFNYKNIYGYVTPDIEGIGMQVDSLHELEEMMAITYWTQNKTEVGGFNGKQDQKETATKTLTDLQGKYARLNQTADWAEQTERYIADFIGEFWFESTWKGANISYGRNYILEDPNTILDTYYDMRKNGVPDSMLDNQYEKYINCLWQSNPIQQLIYHKKFDVEPFPHLSGTEVEASPVILEIDKICKRYFGEWDDTIKDTEWTFKDVNALKQSLIDYATTKQS